MSKKYREDGILPQTPVESAIALVDMVHVLSAK